MFETNDTTTNTTPPAVAPETASTLSDARLAANRENAKKSCGPTTPEGKAKSRLNAVKCGLTGNTVDVEGSATVASGGRVTTVRVPLICGPPFA